ncbi:zinc-dependent alcohol dehydrogenase [Rhodococcus sovatensis]|uniref:Alcohol dehydrogenase catalytic domain-containing protein n=1 Tax=Rhodococcus sovatensis TaxID=1805840 RepID=A0ABZ2PNN5_9NOCA
MVRIAYVGLCGVDASLYKGTSTYIHTGAKTYPFVFGHEWSGTIVEVGAGVKELAPGNRVVGHNFITCDVCSQCRRGHRVNCARRIEVGVLGDSPGAASQYFSVPAKVLAHIPDELSDLEAALLEPGATALHAVERVGVIESDNVVIFGTGTVGLIALQICRAFGATVDVVGIDPAGLELALSMGARSALRPDSVTPDTYSVAIEASGAPNVAATIPGAICDGGRVSLVGVPNSPVPSFPVAPLVLKNATIHAVLSGIDHWDRLIGLVARGSVLLKPLVENTFQPHQATDAFNALLSPNKKRPKVLIDFTTH